MTDNNERQGRLFEPDYYGDENDGSIQPGQTVKEWSAVERHYPAGSNDLFLHLLKNRGVKLRTFPYLTNASVCRCPFPDHADDQGYTFTLSDWRDYFRCRGCYRQGSSTEFLMHYHRVNRDEALRLLAIEEAEFEASRPWNRRSGPPVTMASIARDRGLTVEDLLADILSALAKEADPSDEQSNGLPSALSEPSGSPAISTEEGLPGEAERMASKSNEQQTTIT